MCFVALKQNNNKQKYLCHSHFFDIVKNAHKTIVRSIHSLRLQSNIQLIPFNYPFRYSMYCNSISNNNKRCRIYHSISTLVCACFKLTLNIGISCYGRYIELLQRLLPTSSQKYFISLYYALLRINCPQVMLRYSVVVNGRNRFACSRHRRTKQRKFRQIVLICFCYLIIRFNSMQVC